MPPETAHHERTLMAWPCRRELWGAELAAAKAEYAAVANALVDFEPVTMVVSGPVDQNEARSALTGAIEIIEVPLDDSWMRDNGPVFCLERGGRRAGVHFRFNAWGQKFEKWDRDEDAGATLAVRYGDESYQAPLVLEGGSVIVDGKGRLVTTEQCLLHPNRNPDLGRGDVERALRDYLGAREVVWLGRGLREDRDTDGHVDLIALFNDAGSLLLQSRPPGDPDHEAMAENRERAVRAGLDVIDFPTLAHAQVGGRTVVHSYLNLYLCNGAAIVPLAGAASPATDEEALDLLSKWLPDRQILGTPGCTLAFGGGGPHCITQQVPARLGRA
ncbi:MAG TPA: agmatine deiminase family protein [Acidimicrobiales bacterium]|nr:agmatine deiminase family protein [Acidimicrobiales bacterium]